MSFPDRQPFPKTPRPQGDAFESDRGFTPGGALAALLIAMLVAFSGISYGTRPDSRPKSAVSPRDTVEVYERRFEAASGRPSLHVEEFTLQAVGPGRYRAVIVNGDGSGQNVARSVRISLNGDELRSGEFGTEQALVLDDLALEQINQLEVEVEGDAGSYVTLSVLQMQESTVTILGPVEVIKQGGQSSGSWTFDLPSNVTTPFTLSVNSGYPDGTGRPNNASVELNGVEIFGNSDFDPSVSFLQTQVSLQATNNVLDISVSGQNGNRVEAIIEGIFLDTIPPLVEITRPQSGQFWPDDVIEVRAVASGEPPGATATVNGQTAEFVNDSVIEHPIGLPTDGPHLVTVIVTDAAGNDGQDTATVIRDTQAPILQVEAPEDSSYTNEDSVVVSGTVTEANLDRLLVRGESVVPDAQGDFSATAPLLEGLNDVGIFAEDLAGNATQVVRFVTADFTIPAISITSPMDGTTTMADSIVVSGSVTDANPVAVTVNGVMAAAAEDTFAATIPLIVGANSIIALGTDAAGNQSADTISVTAEQDTTGLPPDPATVAPAIDRTVPTTVLEATEFLYTGVDPIQTGVAPGTIELKRAAAVRGRVIDLTGAPVPGVTVSVKGHPELGETLSRADGAYDLVVNGGGPLTFEYEKSGYLGADRTARIHWQGWNVLDDVVLLQPDPMATTIAFSDPIEVARGTAQSDADGTRQATVLFAQGTQAQMRMPDGSTQPIDTLTVRLTEATVGETGPMAMPAELPPTSAYTYAVDLQVDEAEAAGAIGVEFDQPVGFYVENFAGFPVGLSVPRGRYDEQNGAWLPEPDGRVIEIVDVSGGVAQIDTDGDGSANGQASLDSLGITAAEQQELASLYSIGTSLWHARLTSFSWTDLNWPYGTDGIPPWLDPQQREEEDCPEEVGGSIIECENQVLGEVVPVTASEMTLNYRSSRTPGHRSSYTLDIPITGDSVPTDLLRAIVQIEIAGRVIVDTFETPAPQVTSTFEWDGLDIFGRSLQGATPVDIEISYIYPFLYWIPTSIASSFGLNCQPPGPSLTVCEVPSSLVSRARQEIALSRSWSGLLGTMDLRGVAVAGWSISEHHLYDPKDRVLHRGDGTSRTVEDNSDIATTVAGTGLCDFLPSGDGGPATAATVCDVVGADVAPDGSFYMADRFHTIVRKVDAQGVITTYAGDGSVGFSGDGGPATSAQLNWPADVTFTPDGSLYIADGENGAVRRVSPTGIITTVAGTGTHGFSGDGGPATQAQFDYIDAVAVADDGTLYILDSGNARVRRVDPNGIVRTIAGTGVVGFNGDSLPAHLAQLDPFFGDIELGPDGSVYVADTGNHMVRRIDPSGLMTTVAGTGVGGSFTVDGIPATQSVVDNPTGVAFGRDGSLYITEWFIPSRLRRVTPDGVITTIAGGHDFCHDTSPDALRDNVPATGSPLCFPEDVEVGPDGDVFVGDVEHHRIRKLVPFMDGLRVGDQVIASRDGSEAYVFSGLRHIETRSTLNGVLRYGFAYDSTGRLATITDGDGLVTTVERNGAGEPTAIIAPFGQRTELVVDTAGWISSITNPADEVVTLSHDPLGLLETIEDPRSFQYQFTYDSLGLLERDDDPAGGFQTLQGVQTATGLTVQRTTALGRTWEYGVERLPTAEKERTLLAADGLETVRLVERSGKRTVTPPDATVIETKLGPDPLFAMQAPRLDSLTVTTPGGRILSVESMNHATPTSPATPLVLDSRVDSLVVNGRVWESVFDGTTREITVTTPMGRQYTQELDSLSRVTRVSVPGLTDLDIAYDTAGRISNATTGSRVWQYRYDLLGRLRAIEDPLARADSFVFSAANRLEKTIFANGDSVGFAYDSTGNLTGLTPPGRPEHTFSYSPVDLLASYVAPGADTTAYTNTLDRELGAVIRPGADTISVAYDTAGRPETLTLAGGQIGYSYDPQTGQLAGLTGPYGGSLTFGYDGFLFTDATWSGPVAGSVTLTHDDDLRVSGTDVNGGSAVTFGYDLDGLMTQAGSLTIDRDSANGLVTGTTLGSVTTSRGYNTFGELSDLAAAYSGGDLFETSYVRDALGRVDTLTQVIQGDTTVFVYSYDEIGRLEEVETDGVVTASYTYDPNGNRLQVTGPGGTVTGSYDSQDRLLSYGSATYSYTPAGELEEMVVGPDTTRYAYDALGNLTSVELPDGTTIAYEVDAVGRRIGRRVNGVLQQGFLYRDQLNPVAELDGSGQLVSRFVYGERPNVPEYMVKGGTTYRIVADQLGSVRLVVDVSTGTVAQRIDYDEFGVVIQNTNPGFQPFGFAGGITDDATGLVRFGARDYDPVTGRWTGPDPIGFDGGSSNVYAYVNADPVNLFDLEGQIPFLPVFVGAALGFGLDYLLQRLKEALCECEDPSTPLGPAGNTGLGAAAGATGPFAGKPRAGVAGGGPSGDATSVVSQINHWLADVGVYTAQVRNQITKVARWVTKGTGAAAALATGWQLFDALTCR